MIHKGANDSDFRAGFVAIIGAPNVGKSTLLNKLLGQKLSITSKKPQTTRNRILGIAHRPSAQLIFLDTPGVHRATKPLNLRIVDVAISALSDSDLILMMVDAAKPDSTSEKILIQALRKQKNPVLLAINKIDKVKKPMLLEQIATWNSGYPFQAIIPISAKTGEQTEDLFYAMESLLPHSPPLFPESLVTDMPMRFVVAEMIREKAFRLTGQEIPYAIAVTVDAFQEKNQGKLIHIQASVHVERASQKGVLIGKKGSKIKRIGEAARKDIERMTGANVFLELFVRVQKNWSKDTKALRRFGY
jgi:GTP-binding protein Era